MLNKSHRSVVSTCVLIFMTNFKKKNNKKKTLKKKNRKKKTHDPKKLFFFFCITTCDTVVLGHGINNLV